MAASALKSESLSAFMSPNLRPKARRNKWPGKLAANARLLTTGSTLVYLFAAGSVMDGTINRLTKPKALAAGSAQWPGGHGCRRRFSVDPLKKSRISSASARRFSIATSAAFASASSYLPSALA